MRERRVDGGTLSTQSLRLKFALDEAGSPTDCSPELQSEANYLVAEVCCYSGSDQTTYSRFL
jgi:exoribonuclease R